MHARWTICSSDFGISHSGRNDVTTHLKGKHHRDMARAGSSTRSIGSFFRPQGIIEAEALWSLFVTKHNLSFQSSDHATKLFHRMFPDSEIAKKFAWGHTKTAAIIKHGLAPHYHEQTVHNMSRFFSVLIDESNEKNDKSCIILVRVLDINAGDIRTRFLDMPIVSVGTAQNLFVALKESLHRNNLDFSKCIAFMSDTTNVMKGARSGVQQLIKNECPQVLDVGCICHLADLTVKAGMKALHVDIDQLFVDVFYSYHNSKRKQQFCDLRCPLFTSEPHSMVEPFTLCWSLYCSVWWINVLFSFLWWSWN